MSCWRRRVLGGEQFLQERRLLFQVQLLRRPRTIRLPLLLWLSPSTDLSNWRNWHKRRGEARQWRGEQGVAKGVERVEGV